MSTSSADHRITECPSCFALKNTVADPKMPGRSSNYVEHVERSICQSNSEMMCARLASR